MRDEIGVQRVHPAVAHLADGENPAMDTDPMRLDAPGVTFHYVSDTAQWKARCIAHYLQLDDGIGAQAVALVVDDMAQSARWRLMAPEEAAEIVYGQPR